MATYHFWVPGESKTKGSWARARGGKLRPSGKGRTEWFARLDEELAEQWGGRPLIDGPVGVRMTFVLRRPKTVKREFPTSKRDGDGDKHERAAMDGLTGTVLVDDSLVVCCSWSKVYAEAGGFVGVRVAVENPLPPDVP